MVEQKASNIRWHQGVITRSEREHLNRHKGITVWFTGLSASGKSTLAVALEAKLYQRGLHAYVLDGDNIRHGLNKNLGFSPEDRKENIRRIGEVAALFCDAGIISLTAFISPYREDRGMAREIIKSHSFIEVFVDCPLEVCEERDPKGMYKKARSGMIKDFTGISAPYEIPQNPEIHLHTDLKSIDKCVEGIIDYLIKKGFISA